MELERYAVEYIALIARLRELVFDRGQILRGLCCDVIEQTNSGARYFWRLIYLSTVNKSLLNFEYIIFFGNKNERYLLWNVKMRGCCFAILRACFQQWFLSRC